jgi:hypothetical protein
LTTWTRKLKADARVRAATLLAKPRSVVTALCFVLVWLLAAFWLWSRFQ